MLNLMWWFDFGLELIFNIAKDVQILKWSKVIKNNHLSPFTKIKPESLTHMIKNLHENFFHQIYKIKFVLWQ